MCTTRRLALVALAWAGVGAAGPAPAAGTTSLSWVRDFKTAQRHARAEHKPMLVDFWAEWCAWCHELDRTTYRDPAVVDLAKGFVAVKINAEGSLDEVEVAAQHDVETLPTIAFVSPGGRVFLKRTAYEDPDTFAATLRAAQQVGAEAIGFETALARNGRDAGALAGLGALLAGQDLMKDARELLGRARRLDQARPVAERKRTRRLLAAAEQARGKRSESLAILAEALALQPPDEAEDAEAARLRTEIVGR
jgi:thioredoxin-like negative regulator of GroEL